MEFFKRDGLVPCEVNHSFSCQASTKCIPTVATNTSVICCPQGQDCVLIEPISCDLSQQNATQYPNNSIHTTNLTTPLPTCNSACCPLGYSCQGNACVLQYTPPQASTSSTSSAASSTSSTVALPSSTAQGDTTPTSTSTLGTPTPQPAASSSQSKIGLAIGLSFGAVGALSLILALLWCCKRRKRSKATSYVDEKRFSQSTDFMGTTPRPLQGPSSNTARSVQLVDRRTGAVVSNPISHPDFNSGMPLHRTDFLLRRGSVETGWEDKVKPSWSVRSKYRPKSKLLRSLSKGSKGGASGASKTPDAARMPVFATPLRFGLPTRPRPAHDAPTTPDRPPAGHENMAKLVELSGKTVRSGPAIRVDNQTPSPSRAQKYELRPRDRSESQRRPLVRDNSADRHFTGPGGNSPYATPTRGRSPARARSKSETTIATSDSGSAKSWNDDDDEKSGDPNRVTMNVMFYSPEPTPPFTRVRDDEVLGKGGLRRQTTFADLMNRAAEQSSH